MDTTYFYVCPGDAPLSDDGVCDLHVASVDPAANACIQLGREVSESVYIAM